MFENFNCKEWKIKKVPFDDLVGKTIVDLKGLEIGSDCIELRCSDGTLYTLAHRQECCEQVDIEDINGDSQCLINRPILKAEENSQKDPEAWCAQWTFYSLATIKGYVDIRWYGSSNGCYAVDADLRRYTRRKRNATYRVLQKEPLQFKPTRSIDRFWPRQWI